MEIDKLSDIWLYQRHSKQTIKAWVNHLKYFYFIRAWGGHANDGDTFKVGINYTDKEDLIFRLGQLELTLDVRPEDFPAYSTIFGYKAFVCIYDNTIEISISGTKDENYYEVTEADYKVCLELESKFDTLNWYKLTDKTLEKKVCCVSKTKYPELFV